MKRCKVIMDEVDWFAYNPMQLYKFKFDNATRYKLMSITRAFAEAESFIGLTGSFSMKAR